MSKCISKAEQKLRKSSEICYQDFCLTHKQKHLVTVISCYMCKLESSYNKNAANLSSYHNQLHFTFGFLHSHPVTYEGYSMQTSDPHKQDSVKPKTMLTAHLVSSNGDRFPYYRQLLSKNTITSLSLGVQYYYCILRVWSLGPNPMGGNDVSNTVCRVYSSSHYIELASHPIFFFFGILKYLNIF